MCLIFAFLLSINSFAAVMSDNDGSAFITKAEFDSLKNDFQSKIDAYNLNIDNKIDAAIAGYLAGIKTTKTETLNIMLWGGRKLGLIENEYSRPYVEGRVGGRLDFTLYASSQRSGSSPWYSGKTQYNDSQTIGSQNAGWFKTCFHRFEADIVPFKYAVVDVNKTGDRYYFNLLGYSSVNENLVGLHRTHEQADKTQRKDWTIGLCSGIYPWRGALETKPSDYTNDFAEFCEATTRNSSYGAYAARGASFNDHHNRYLLTWQDVNLSSEPTIDNSFGYITNASSGEIYGGVRSRAWHGINKTLGSTENHTKGEFHMWGWNVVGARGSKYNFHIDARPAEGGDMFTDGAGVFNRIIQEDPNYTSGSWGHYASTMRHGKVEDDYPFYNMFKADIGGELTSNNLYSNELADAIKSKIKDSLITREFNGQLLDVSPLYLGLPIVEVKEKDTVEIELEFLDNSASYDVGFAVNGFDNNPIDSSSLPDWGCKAEGIINPIYHVPASRTKNKEKLKIEITKPGLLFMKYGATGGTSQYIQLPLSCTRTSSE